MRFEPALHECEVVAMLTKFEEIAGMHNSTRWSQRLARLRKGASESGEGALHAQRCALELAWATLRDLKPWTVGAPINVRDDQAPFVQLAAMVTLTYQRLGETGKRRLEGMLRDAINREFGLAPLDYEMQVARHLMHKQFDVEFNDMEGRRPAFDFLAMKKDLSAEVECKFITGDIGRKVHRALCYRLIDSLRETTATRQQVGRLRKGLIVRLVVSGRLRRDQEQQATLSKLLKESLLGWKSAKTGSAHISVREFDAALAAEWVNAAGLDRGRMEKTLRERLGLANKNMGVFVQGKGVVVVVVDSDEPDNVLSAIYSELLDSAKRQLSGSRPGILACHLADVRGDQLASLARQEREDTGLEDVAAYVFERRPHVHSVVYTAPPHVARQLIAGSDGYTEAVSTGGVAYTVSNPRHPMSGDRRLFIYQ